VKKVKKVKKIIAIGLIASIGLIPCLVNAETTEVVSINELKKVNENLMGMRKAIGQYGQYQANARSWTLTGYVCMVAGAIGGEGVATIGGIGSLGCFGYAMYCDWKSFKVLEENWKVAVTPSSFKVSLAF
jgi:uncharacterized membrane protein YebE (DUF533 family)